PAAPLPPRPSSPAAPPVIAPPCRPRGQEVLARNVREALKIGAVAERLHTGRPPLVAGAPRDRRRIQTAPPVAQHSVAAPAIGPPDHPLQRRHRPVQIGDESAVLAPYARQPPGPQPHPQIRPRPVDAPQFDPR